jgi:hypothetical protein
MRQSVGHIQTKQEYYLPSKKARALERGCIVAKKGAKGPIFEGNMLPPKNTPFSCAVNSFQAIRVFARIFY